MRIKKTSCLKLSVFSAFIILLFVNLQSDENNEKQTEVSRNKQGPYISFSRKAFCREAVGRTV